MSALTKLVKKAANKARKNRKPSESIVARQ
jgi:hypothetical protein